MVTVTGVAVAAAVGELPPLPHAVIIAAKQIPRMLALTEREFFFVGIRLLLNAALARRHNCQQLYVG
jgi:hypothetical protein